MKKIQAIRGMHDLLPDQSPIWQYIESSLSEILHGYAYKEIRFPILEKTELFKRSIGEVTDIVEKEMYAFDDRNGDSLSLRPEGTACCVRACEENGLLYNQIQRLWYMGPMFRHERPQKGRLRQFHQLGVEAFGIIGPDIDVEMILISARLWKVLGIGNNVSLEINSLGSNESRVEYKTTLVSFLETCKEELDEDSLRRLESNPLRILDSKNEKTQSLLKDAPKLLDFLDQESKEHFEQIQMLLTELDIPFEINPKLVRGLDYYNRTVFEWTTDKLGAQGTICAGGRYDGLVEQLGGKATPAVGFALGIERLALLLEALELVPDFLYQQVDLYVLAVDEAAQNKAFYLAESLRDQFPQYRVLTHCGGGNLKNQMKKADKSGACLALILGEEEISTSSVSVKFLREDLPQQQVASDKLYDFLVKHI